MGTHLYHRHDHVQYRTTVDKLGLKSNRSKTLFEYITEIGSTVCHLYDKMALDFEVCFSLVTA